MSDLILAFIAGGAVMFFALVVKGVVDRLRQQAHTHEAQVLYLSHAIYEAQRAGQPAIEAVLAAQRDELQAMRPSNVTPIKRTAGVHGNPPKVSLPEGGGDFHNG